MSYLQKTLTAIRHEPGVYLFYNTHGDVIYIGKAVDLFRRVHQYFHSSNRLNDKTKQLVSEISRIETVPVTSEFDALLLEAKLIRVYLPKYNVVLRDDKSPLYVVFTLSEELPRVLMVRKNELPHVLKDPHDKSFGPFQSAHALRILLRQIRMAVPYCTQKIRNGKSCFYTHIGLCKPCPSHIISLPHEEKRGATQSYRKNIYRLKAIFDGKTNIVRSQYEKAMHHAASLHMFEEAGEYKRRIDALYKISEHRYDPAIFLEREVEDVYENELDSLLSILHEHFPHLTKLTRIECFDMSQLFGSHAVGSMVVVINGQPDTSEYRRFKIRATDNISDTSMMKEVLLRRYKHDEWPKPDFILIDGGKPQLRVARDVLSTLIPEVPYAGLAKRYEELIVPTHTGFKTIRLPLSGLSIKVLQRARDEAHRFAITYHRHLRTFDLGF